MTKRTLAVTDTCTVARRTILAGGVQGLVMARKVRRADRPGLPSKVITGLSAKDFPNAAIAILRHTVGSKWPRL